jgi:nicotinamide mononucleotide (NMN) deamidase PncC
MSEASDRQLIDLLRTSLLNIATVESCTGGLLAHRLTQVAGSSEVFWGSWIVYDNSAKETQVHVPHELLTRHGAVSWQVAGALAEGGLKAMSRAIESTERAPSGGVLKTNRRVCVATTGIAGPGGGTTEKPVGLCYIGLAATGAPTQVIEVHAPSGASREANKAAFADAALSAVEKLVRQLPDELSS